MNDNQFDAATNALDADEFVNKTQKSKSESSVARDYGIKLITSGRLDKKNFPCKPMNLHIDQRLDEWLEHHRAGNRQLMLNFLIAKGIEKIINSD